MAEKQSDSTMKAWGQIVAKAWTDEGFKQRLLADPAAVLKEHGITVLPGAQVRVVENTAQMLYLTLPNRPRDAEIAVEVLGRVTAAGQTQTFLSIQQGSCVFG